MNYMKQKIGILTFHRSINYGSVLQAWALQKVLLKEGYDVEIIDYKPQEYDSIYEKTFINAHGIKSKIKSILMLRKYEKLRQNLFKVFREKHLILSQKQYTFVTHEEEYKCYDIIITGSDQIWNTSIQDCDPIYFLPFPYVGKKIAYACSINNGTINEKYSERWIRKWISDYDFISIREQSGVDKISTLLKDDTRIYKTLDPTLLLQKETFEELIDERNIQENYIFLYNMWTKKDGIIVARKLSKRINLPVYTITNQIDLIRIYKYSIRRVHVDLKHTSPEDFINFIRFANYVVTDSFHGTAFSIIFNKPFIAVNSYIANGHLKNDERLINILNEFGVSERYISVDDINSFNFDKDINYQAINVMRSRYATQSLNLLLEAIRGKENNDRNI